MIHGSIAGALKFYHLSDISWLVVSIPVKNMKVKWDDEIPSTSGKTINQSDISYD